MSKLCIKKTAPAPLQTRTLTQNEYRLLVKICPYVTNKSRVTADHLGNVKLLTSDGRDFWVHDKLLDKAIQALYVWWHT